MTADGYDTFAAVGGDGTVGEVISALMERDLSDLELAIIPAGTGNDIARNLGVTSIEDAVDALRNRRPRAIEDLAADSVDAKDREWGAHRRAGRRLFPREEDRDRE